LGEASLLYNKMHHKKSGELVSSFLPGLFCLADAQVRKKPPPALGGGVVGVSLFFGGVRE
jgi:hypothetical protein